MDIPPKPEIYYFETVEKLSLEAAGLVCRRAVEEVGRSGSFAMALAGGRSPRILYETLARPPFMEDMPWGRCHFFWSDERCVPAEDQESNFGMASQALLRKVSVPEANIHRMPAGAGSPEEAARRYESELRMFFSADPRKRFFPSGGEEFPRFDLILLGVGADGHTASLFPGSTLLEEETRWVAAAEAPASCRTRMRLTLTLPVLNSAACVLFLVAGEGKVPVLERLLGGREPAEKELPAAQVKPVRGELVWLVNLPHGRRV
ncbi:MAG: 6-phosphogluconolactonase [Candidatus Glassbacteria bacterium]|nr:6-phosphogluconolactonase [Candidatus Glassbacteria bacterium]